MDDVARAIDEWRRRDPGLDVDSMEVVLRLARLGARIATNVDPVHRRAELMPGDFDVLATLLRGGARTPTALARSLLLSKAGMSGRLSRLQQRGLVADEPDERDGRGKLLRLTDAGRRVVDGVIRDHAAAEREALGPLTDEERRHLIRLLRQAMSDDSPHP